MNNKLEHVELLKRFQTLKDSLSLSLIYMYAHTVTKGRQVVL